MRYSGVDAAALLAFTFGLTLISCSLWMAVMGAISAFFAIVVKTYLQTEPPAEMRSRVLGWFWAIYGPINVVSLLLAMWLSSTYGAVEILRGAAVAEFIAAAALGFSVWSGTR